MTIEEAQILAGEVAAYGGIGPQQRWIVAAPFGKTHVRSIDDPTELQVMPLSIARTALADGRLRLLGRQPDHPAVRLQRIKENNKIHDTHMGLYGDNLARMLKLLRDAVAAGEDYAPYAAGEILAMLRAAQYRFDDTQQVRQEVDDLVRRVSGTN
jgi:hypothetical protein